MDKTYTLITGASSGIGKGLAKEFAKNGHNLILVARRIEKLETLAQALSTEFSISAISKQCDLSNSNDIDSMCHELSDKYVIDILINNAGLGDFTLFEHSQMAKNNRLIDLNINAVVQLTHNLLPQMTKQKSGKILNIASMAAHMPGPYIAVYAATKSFILNFSHALASEVKEQEILVSVLSPGDIKTEFQENANLKGFDVKSNITVEDLCKFTYEEFVVKGEREIIPSETRKIIEMMNRSGKASSISDNLLRMRKQLAKKLGTPQNFT